MVSNSKEEINFSQGNILIWILGIRCIYKR